MTDNRKPIPSIGPADERTTPLNGDEDWITTESDLGDD